MTNTYLSGCGKEEDNRNHYGNGTYFKCDGQGLIPLCPSCKIKISERIKCLNEFLTFLLNRTLGQNIDNCDCTDCKKITEIKKELLELEGK